MKARISVDLVSGHSHTSLVAAVFTSGFLNLWLAAAIYFLLFSLCVWPSRNLLTGANPTLRYWSCEGAWLI